MTMKIFMIAHPKSWDLYRIDSNVEDHDKHVLYSENCGGWS